MRRAVAAVCVVAAGALPLLVVPTAQAVVPTTQPAITGTPKVGMTLAARGATWPVPGSSTFAWYVGEDWVGKGPTYRVGRARLGQVITLREAFTPDGSTERSPAEADSAIVVEGDPPTPTRPLSVTGASEVGSTLVTTKARFPVKGVTTLTWTIDGARVDTGRSYTMRPADLGKVVRLTQRFSSNGYAPTFLAFDTAPVALGPAPTAFGRPAISGRARVGARLKVTGGTWSAPGRSRYAWSVDGVEVARGRSYVVAVRDVRSRVTVTETLTSTGYAPGSVSAQSPVVAPAPVRLRIKVGKARAGRRVAVVIRAVSPGPAVPGKVRVGYAGRSLGKERLTRGRTSLWLPRKKHEGSQRLRVVYPGKRGFAHASRTIRIRLR
ncbi:hypothetical protein [Nocardioides sp. YIM 152315]|uniref:hypothetical protein n=1 Tax=Nocardioides sp. YIM 152315 TaxID=3031760 RepID=UPI0023DB046B|nr:hypothetical protein [Nocardioides sp. YIM 152315]MDF1605734.1 hypothetical protein [Nocardioides sp. YIM 152315]